MVIKPPFGTPLNLAHPLAQGLVGCWLFNEGGGTWAYDLSGQRRHGELGNIANPPSATSGWGPGPHGGALIFDGIDDYILCPAINIGTGPVSFLAWVKGNSIPSNQERGIVGAFGTGYFFELERSSYGSGSLTMIVGYPTQNPNELDGGIWAPSDISPHFVGMTRDSTKMALYLDGIQVQSSTHVNFTNFNVGNLPIIFGYPSQKFFSGSISAVMVYNRAFSAEEVAFLHAFPYCMFDEPAYPAWMIPSNIPAIVDHYRRLAA